MHYEINVSINGRHLFATAERSLTDKVQCIRVYDMLAKRFLKEDGFEINISLIERSGMRLTREQLVD